MNGDTVKNFLCLFKTVLVNKLTHFGKIGGAVIGLTVTCSVPRLISTSDICNGRRGGRRLFWGAAAPQNPVLNCIENVLTFKELRGYK